MKKRMNRFWVCLLILTLVEPAFAQVDPSTLVILKSSRKDKKETTDIDLSDRYEVRKKPMEPAPTPEPDEDEKDVDDETAKPSENQSSPPLRKIEQATTLPLLTPVPTPTNAEDEPSFKSMRDIVIGGAPSTLEEYRSFLPPDDIRRNLLELSLGTFFLYNDSSSSYWFRRYSNAAPGIGFGADIWFTPLFGLNAAYSRTIGGEVNDSPTSNESTTLTQEWLSIGLRFRRFFGFNEKASSFLLGFDYWENQFRVPSDDAFRPRLKTSGPRVLLETRMPKNSRTSSLLGLEIFPWLKQTEIPTGIDLRSGELGEVFGLTAFFGEEYKLARTNRIFWKVKVHVEKMVFSGGASQADPISGTTPSTVPVTNTTAFFELGFTWGR